MASTLLAVDDSATMRKVLEITFAGSDIQVVTANGFDAALQKLKSDSPDIVIADVSLDPKTGYDLCKAVKEAAPGVPVLMLSSKQNPYDAGKGSGVKADDYIDKPFDTQQLIDKVRKLLASKSEGATAAPVAAAAKPAAAGARAKTLIYSPPSPAAGAATPPPAAAAAKPAAAAKQEPLAPTPVSGVPLQQKTPSAAPAASVAAVASANHINGHMAGKLDGMGLSPAQVDAVLALSRDVVERVVWEVVPVLAETIIKEEIARLTK